MVLSQPSKYAIRAVLHLAQHEGKLLHAEEISTALEIPQHFLAKILQDLSRRGLLRSSKGRRGGFQIAKSISEISLLDVVKTIEGENFGEGCLLGLKECSEESTCPLHSQWAAIKERVFVMLDDKSVLELLEEISFTPDEQRE